MRSQFVVLNSVYCIADQQPAQSGFSFTGDIRLFFAYPPSAGATALSAPNDRPLGVVEALVAVRDQCPHAAVRDHAASALDAIEERGSAELRQQVFLVLSTIAGWRGERAAAVKQALRAFLDQTQENGEEPGWSRSE